MRRKETVALILFSATMVTLTILSVTIISLPGAAGDSYPHLTALLRFVDGLPGDLFQRPVYLFAQVSHGGRPPLYHIVATPFVLLFGRSESAALLVNIVFYLVLIVSVYNIGLLVKNARVGFLSAFLAATYPPVVHLSHTFLPVFALVGCGALSVWLLLVLVNHRTVKSAWLFGASVAAGLLVHPNFIWLIGSPALFSVVATFRGEHGGELWHWGRWPGQRRFLLVGLVPSAAVFLTIVLSWYLTFGENLFALYKSITERSELRDSAIVVRGFPQVEASSLWYAKTAPMALSNVLVLCFVIGLIAAMCSRRLDRWILVVTAITSLILLSLQSVFHWMYVAQVLPIVAVLSTAWIVQVRPRWLATSLSLLVLAAGLVNLMIVTFGARPWIRPAATLLEVCPENGYSLFCSRPLSESQRRLRKGESPEREILEAVLEDPDCRGSRSCVLWHINIGRPARFGFYRVKYWPGSELATATTGSHTWGRPFYFSTFLDSDYLVYPITPLYTDSRRLYDTAAIRFLGSPPPEFAQAHKVVGEFESPNRKVKIHLLKRVKALTAAEASASISAFDLPEKYKTQANELLVSLYRKEERLDKAVELCAIEAQPHLSQAALGACLGARVGLARTLKSEGKTTDAIAELKAAMRFAPQSSLPVRVLADVHRERRENDEALTLYREALRINPRDLPARIHLAILYHWNLGNSEKAVEELNEARSLFPETSWPLRVQADIHRERGKSEEALRLYQQALRIDPKDLAARVQLAVLYHHNLGRSDKAVEELNEASSLSPESAWPVRVRANMHRDRGEIDEAVKLYQTALRIDPRDLNSRISLAMVYRNRKGFERAIEELNEASSLFPETAWPLRVLADIYREMGDEKQALAHIVQAVQVDPRDLEARLLLGRIYEQYGKPEEAKRAYRDLLVIDPDHRVAKNALSRLATPE